METKVDLDARKEWPAIEARNKLAFFAADLSQAAAGAPVLTYTTCFPDEGWTREGADAVKQKLSELAAAIHDALTPNV